MIQVEKQEEEGEKYRSTTAAAALSSHSQHRDTGASEVGTQVLTNTAKLHTVMNAVLFNQKKKAIGILGALKVPVRNLAMIPTCIHSVDDYQVLMITNAPDRVS